jgi:hypothetical protein
MGIRTTGTTADGVTIEVRPRLWHPGFWLFVLRILRSAR